MDRPKLIKSDLDIVKLEIIAKLEERLKQKGDHILVSAHEILGVVKEEFDELSKAVRQNNIEGVKRELIDIAVACILGLASIKSQKMDW